MATNLSTCHPGEGIEALNRLPGLAEPLLQIDLERELQQLRREDSWQRETGRSAKTVAKYPDFRIVLILMNSGTRMRHQSEAKRVNELSTTPTLDQTLSFQYPLRGALWTFCSPKRMFSAVATVSGRLRNCSAKSRSLTTTSPVG